MCRIKQLNSWMIQLSWTTGRHLPYGITQCYLSPDTSKRTPPNPSQTGRYSINLPRRNGRLSWPRWLGTFQDGLPASRQSPIQVVTVPSVEQLCCVTTTTTPCSHPTGSNCTQWSTNVNENNSVKIITSRNTQIFIRRLTTNWLYRFITVRPASAGTRFIEQIRHSLNVTSLDLWSHYPCYFSHLVWNLYAIFDLPHKSLKVRTILPTTYYTRFCFWSLVTSAQI